MKLIRKNIKINISFPQKELRTSVSKPSQMKSFKKE